MRKITKEQLLEELIELSKKLNKIPTKEDITKHSKYSTRPYQHIFGGIINALIEAGLTVKKQELTKEFIINEIKEFHKKYGKVPSRQDMYDKCLFTYKQMRIVFDYEPYYKICAQLGFDKAPLDDDARLIVAQKLAEAKGGKCLSTKCSSATEMLNFECEEKHKFSTNINRLKTRDSWCSECSSGLYERICRSYFEQLFNCDFSKAYFPWLKNQENNRMELDGYSTINLAFEHNGSQHYRLHKIFMPTEDTLEKRKKDDEVKIQLCKEHGITLITIPELNTYDVSAENLKEFIKSECIKANFPLPNNYDDIIIDFSKIEWIKGKFELDKVIKIAAKQNVKILSEAYLGNRTPLLCECKCGFQFWKKPIYIKRQRFICSECRKKCGLKLTTEEIENIMDMHNKGYTLEAISEEIGSSPTTISYQINKRTCQEKTST